MKRFSVDGALRLSVDGVPATLTADEACLTLAVEHPFSFLRRAGPTTRLKSVIAFLASAGLTLTLEHRGLPLIVAGGGVPTGWAASLFGYSHLRISSVRRLILALIAPRR